MLGKIWTRLRQEEDLEGIDVGKDEIMWNNC